MRVLSPRDFASALITFMVALELRPRPFRKAGRRGGLRTLNQP
jgi:hypothetical protein